MKLKKGDYVVATKYIDGDSKDHFVVGFFKDMTWHNRYNIIDDTGVLYRGNGFRKAKLISKEIGDKLVSCIDLIQNSNKSVWYFVSKFENEQ